MYETIQEFFDSRGVAMRVDRPAGVIRGVKILGLESRNGRVYTPQALVASLPLYEGAKVNVNHPKGHPQAPRDYQDRIGVIRSVAFREHEGLFGDFHYNPAHALAEQLAWDAEHAQENVGFSHNVQARTSQQGQRLVVEAITRVQSVDLVADPATTRGLFEAASAATGSIESSASNAERLAELTIEQLREQRPDLVRAIEGPLEEQLRSLAAQIDRVNVEEAARQKRALGYRLLAEFTLPSPEADDAWSRAIVSPTFFEALLAAPDEPAMRRIVEDRARLVHSARNGSSSRVGSGLPVSRDQQLVEGARSRVMDAAEFVRSIT
jgi:hypothetical protein